MTTFFSLSSFTVSALVALLAGAAPALATTETTPSSWELSAPTGGQAASAQAATGNAVPAQNPTPQQRTTSAPVSRPASDDPCPSPRMAKGERPDDLAQVQEDIDRFTLCVQRAQLLERLNDSAGRMTQSADSALGYSGTASAAPSGGGMPPLPAGALGGMDVSPQPAPGSTAPTQTTTTTSSVVETTTTQVSTSDASTSDGGRLLIREIFGPVTDMQARLVTAQGNEILVRQGTALKDGGIVTTITPSGVSVRGKQGVSTLEWSGD